MHTFVDVMNLFFLLLNENPFESLNLMMMTHEQNTLDNKIEKAGLRLLTAMKLQRVRLRPRV